MPFEFIDSTAPIDTQARQRIRRQAALGKNVGRKISRPSRADGRTRSRPQPYAPVDVTSASPGSPGVADVESAVAGVEQPERQIGTGFSMMSLPQRQQFGSGRLLQQAISFIIHAPRAMDLGIGRAIDPGDVHLFSRLIFIDEAYFHCAMALSIRALGPRCESPKDAALTIATQHLSRSLRLISERFSGASRVTDANIAVVVVMSEVERMNGQIETGKIHLDGLEKMIQLRKGIRKLQPALVEKILRADLSFAFQVGAKPRISVADVRNFAEPTVGLKGPLSIADKSIELLIANPAIIGALGADYRKIFLDAMKLTRVIDEADSGKRERLGVRHLHASTLLMGYKLVQLSPSGNHEPKSSVDAAVRLGLICFLVSFFRTFDNRVLPVASGLSSIAQSTVNRLELGQPSESELLLWLLCVGSTIKVFDTISDPNWVTSRIGHILRCLNLESCQEMTAILLKFPWSQALYPLEAQSLWLEANRYNRANTGVMMIP